MEKGGDAHSSTAKKKKKSNKKKSRFAGMVYLLAAPNTLEDESNLFQQYPDLVGKYSHSNPFEVMKVEVRANDNTFIIKNSDTDVSTYICPSNVKMEDVDSGAKIFCNLISNLMNDDTEIESQHENQSTNTDSITIVNANNTDYECKQCDKTFSQEQYLKQHMEIHNGTKKYVCDECGKRLKTSSTLKRHMEVHTDTKDYKCNECGKMFNRRHHLKQHMKIHSDIKGYECKDCGKTFNRDSYLKQHMEIHNGTKSYECTACDKTFNRAHHLKQHMKVHTGTKDHECTKCGKKYNQRSSLTRHVAKVHSNEKCSM